jgi:hypothetical protein
MRFRSFVLWRWSPAHTKETHEIRAGRSGCLDKTALAGVSEEFILGKPFLDKDLATEVRPLP